MIRMLDDLDVDGAALGVRVDINSPLSGGGLADDARLRAHVETISELCRRGGRVALLAHQGRPGGDEFSELETHAERLDELIEASVDYCDSTFSSDARARIDELDSGSAILLENTRFYSEEYMSFTPEQAAETYLVTRLSPALDAYVNDAFATSHRRHPSIIGFPQLLPAYAGRVMERELNVLGNIDESPEPRIYVLGGAKVDDSISVARSVLERGLADSVLTAGIVGNAFLLADGVSLGAASAAVVNERSHEAVKQAGDLLDDFSHRIYMPRDVAVEVDGERAELDLEELPTDKPAMDIGARTVAAYADFLESAGTAILNGPAGVFEDARFEIGTLEVYESATRAEMSIVGGGDTASALRKLGLLDGFDHVSTGGGAALKMLTGDTLVGVDALDQ